MQYKKGVDGNDIHNPDRSPYRPTLKDDARYIAQHADPDDPRSQAVLATLQREGLIRYRM